MNPPEAQEREFFTPEENAELKETRAKEYEQIMAEAKEYVKQAEINEKLNELEAKLQSEKAGLEKRVTEKLALLEEFRKKKQQEEGNGNGGPMEALEEGFKAKLRKVPIIGPLLVDCFGWVKDAEKAPSEDAGFFDKFWTKALGLLGAGILSIFGYRKLKRELDGVTKELEEGTSSALSQAGELLGGEKEEGNEKPNEGGDLIDLERTYFRIGGTILISLNFRSVLEEEPDEDCIIPSLNLIENVKLSELRLLNEKEDGYLELCKEANGEKLDDKQKKNLKMVIQAMCSDDTKGILKFSLTPKLINSLNERGILDKYFKGKSKDIVSKIGKEDFLENLTIKELSILYMQAIPIISLLNLEGLSDLKDDIIGFIGRIDIKGMLEEAIVPASLIKSFSKAYINDNKPTMLGGNSALGEDKGTVMKKVSEKIDEMKNLSDEQKDKDKKILESIIDFKDKIYQKGKIEGNTFLQNKKLNLSEEQKKAFIGNLDYRWIIALYGILGGDVNLENISPINLPILIYTIANIIDDNKGGKQEYMASFTKRAFSENSNIFTPEERAVFDIYKEKIVSGTIAIWLKWYLEAIGWVKGGLGENFEVALTGVGLTSFMANAAGKALVRRGLGVSTIGSVLRVGGFRGMLISAVITGLELYVGIKTGETPNPFGFFDDIGRELKEGNAEGVIEIFENLKKSTKIYETKNGEKVAIVEYNGGIYAVYNQKIWGIDIINEGLNLDIAADVLTGWFEDNSLKNVKMSGDTLEFDRNDKRDSIDLKTKIENSNSLQVWNDQGVLKTALQYYGFLKESSEGGKNYIKLGELGEGTGIYLSLVELGSVPTS